MSERREGLSSLAANATQLTSARLLTQLARGIYLVVIARALGPELYAMLAFAQSWYMAFLPFALFGLASVLAKEIGSRPEQTQDLVNIALAISFLATFAAATVSTGIGWLAADSNEVFTLIVIMSLALVGRAGAMFANQVFIATENSKFVLKLETVFRITEVCLGIIILSIGGGLYEIASLHALVWWIHALWGRHIGRESLSLKTAPAFSKNEMLCISKSALCFIIIGLLNNWLFHGPLVLFNTFSEGGAVAGNFAIVMQMLFLLTALPQSVGAAALPVVSRAAMRGDGREVLFLSVTVRAAFLVGGVGGLLGDAVGPWFISTLFGPGFELAGYHLDTVLWYLIPLFIVFVLPQPLFARDKSIGVIVANALGAAVLTLSLVPMTNELGMSGGLYAVGLGLAVTSVMLFFTAMRHSLISFREDLWPAILTVSFAYVVQSAASSLGPAISGVLGAVALLVLVPLAGVVKKNEVDMVISVLRRLGKRRG